MKLLERFAPARPHPGTGLGFVSYFATTKVTVVGSVLLFESATGSGIREAKRNRGKYRGDRQ